jgi:hypothetical protein
MGEKEQALDGSAFAFFVKKPLTHHNLEEIIRLPWRGQCDRAAAARALCACCAAGGAKDPTGSPVCF